MAIAGAARLVLNSCQNVFMASNLAKITAVLVLSWFYTSAHASVLDWSMLTWTPGSLSNSYDIDPNNPGNDITITFSGDTADLRTDGGTGLQSPDISQTLHGGQTPGAPSLYWETILVTSSNSITITISFSPTYVNGAGNVSFTLFDIDRKAAPKQDQISSIFGLATDGITQIAPTITDVGSAVSLTGTGLNQLLTGMASSPSTGAGSGDGNATISFNSPGIQSISFTFGNPDFAQSPNTQFVSLFNISFVPEINPAFAAAVVCLLALAVSLFRQNTRVISKFFTAAKVRLSFAEPRSRSR